MFSKNVLSLGLIAVAAALAAGNYPPLRPEQNWIDSVRHKFWYIDQGARVMPLEWFKKLELAQSDQKFWIGLDRYGFINDDFGIPKTMKAALAGLPIGFSVNENDNWVGITCAACHTGVIRHGEQRYMIEGAPGMIWFDRFVSEMVDAMESTIKDKAKHDRFFTKEMGAGAEAEFASLLGRHAMRRLINTPKEPAGFGRLDAFGHIFNTLVVEHLGNDPSKAIKSIAPASYPVLWDIAQHDRVQWNNSAPNLGVGKKAVGSLLRNVIEVLGVFGTATIVKSKGFTGETWAYKSSANIPNLQTIEGLLEDLRSPRWPFKGPNEAPNEAKARHGRDIYQVQCSHCHAVLKDPSKATYPFPSMPIPIGGCSNPGKCVGTEKELALISDGYRAPTKILEGAKMKMHPRQPFRKFGDCALVFEIGGHLAISVVTPEVALSEALLGTIKAIWEGEGDMMVYKARPLNGIWASAPYLHNGSVPNLWEMLQKPEKRMPKFCVGDSQYDLKNVGFQTYANRVSQCPDHTTVVNTELKGSMKIGHDFGTDLSDSDKWDLIEFLKSL